MLALLGKRLRQERQRQGLTLHDVSAKSGISLSMISAVERGHRNVTYDTLRRLCDALGLALHLDIAPSLSPADEHLVARLRALLPGLDLALRTTLELLIGGWEASSSSVSPVSGSSCQENVKRRKA